MEFEWSEDETRHRDEIRAFLADTLPDDWDEISRHGPGGDSQAVFSKEFCGKLAEKGWLTQHWPSEYGGQDTPPWRHSIVGEEMWAIGEPRGPQYMNVNWIGPAIMKYGSDEQKAHHLPPIAAGQVFWCQGFSEPDHDHRSGQPVGSEQHADFHRAARRLDRRMHRSHAQ